MLEPLVASLRPCGAVPNLIPASSGSGVLARLTTATLPLSVPKPDADQEPTRERPECARDGAAAPSCGQPAGVKSQAKSMLQNRGVSPGVGEGSRRSPLDGGQGGPLDQRTVSKPWISSHRRPLPSWEKRTAVPGTRPPAMT